MSLSNKHTRLVVYALCAGSGFSGLVYEVVWARLLHITLGSTTLAISLVLAAFMAGLAIGSLVAGRQIDRRANILKIYAGVEVGIGLCAFLSPWLLAGLNPVYVWLYQTFPDSSYVLYIARFGLSFLVLIIPAALMGATLPVLSKFFVKKRDRLGATMAFLYGYNTLGATAGCFLTGFVLIEALGIIGTIMLAASINVLIAVSVFALSARAPEPVSPETDQPPAETKKKQHKTPATSKPLTVSPSLRRLVLIAFALSGFISLGYEVLWTRVIGFYAGNTSYAFSTMLTTFLLGLGLGSLFVSRIVDRVKSLMAGFGLVEILIGLCGLASIALFAGVVQWAEPTAYGESGATPLWMKFTFSFVVMFVPTLLMGATFPIVIRLFTRELGLLGRSIGDVYSVNTLGCILGSLAASFVIIPLFGIQTGLLILAVANLLLGTTLILSCPESSRTRKFAYVSATVVALLATTTLTWQSGNVYSSEGSPIMPEGRSIYYREGIATTVEILENTAGDRHLILDGCVNASTSAIGVGTRIHALMSQLPVLMHPDPHSILLVALGSGMTSGGTLCFENLDTIECAEISEDVVEASRYFTKWNHGIVDSSRFTLHIEDGRNFALTTPRTYDVISTGIIHPKYNSGNAGLYSEDYYRVCRSKLNPGGVICQWAPLYGLTDTEFKMIIKTFQSVFPHASLWFAQSYGSIGSSNALLVGTLDSAKVDFATLQSVLSRPRVAETLAREGIDDIYELLDCFVLGEEELAAYVAGDIPLNTDNKPLLEFGAIEMHYPEILTELASIREPVWPHLSFAGLQALDSASIVTRLEQYYTASDFAIAADLYSYDKDYNSALATYCDALLSLPESSDLLYQYRQLQNRAHRALARELAQKPDGPQKVQQLARRLEGDLNNVEDLFRMGYVYQQEGWIDAAIGQYRLALYHEPENPRVRYNLAVALNRRNQPERAMEELERVWSHNPEFSEAYAYAGYLYSTMGDTMRAVDLLEQALRVNDKNQLARTYLTQLGEAQNRPDDHSQRAGR